MLGIRTPRHAIALALMAALALGACGGDDDDAASDTGAGEDTSSDGDGSTDDELVDPPAGGSTNGEPVDVCALVDAAAVSEAVGTEFGAGTPGTPTGSLLGQCDFAATDITTADIALVSVSARPASEYDGTVSASGNATPAEGFSGDANHTDAGLLLRYDDFMLVVLAVAPTGGFDDEAEEAVGLAIDAQLG